jgi:hypothetical protein
MRGFQECVPRMTCDHALKLWVKLEMYAVEFEHRAMSDVLYSIMKWASSNTLLNNRQRTLTVVSLLSQSLYPWELSPPPPIPTDQKRGGLQSWHESDVEKENLIPCRKSVIIAVPYGLRFSQYTIQTTFSFLSVVLSVTGSVFSMVLHSAMANSSLLRRIANQGTRLYHFLVTQRSETDRKP